LNDVGEISGEIGAERNLGLLLKTGQTTQYGGYEDDGYFEKGLSKQYTVLTLGQYAGTTSITLNSKTDAHSNNCVYDRRTKLTWSRYAAGSVGPASDGNLPWTTNVNGEGVFAYAAAANAASLGEYSDWRIPNREEFFSLLNAETSYDYPNSTAFPSFPTKDVWTSTTNKINTTRAWCFSPENELPLYSNTKTLPFHCLLVRGG
jgi:hypothetical protein